MVRRIKAKLVLRLRAEGFSARQIEAQGMSRHSVVAVFDLDRVTLVPRG
jgi:hypothetical protein